MSFTLEIRRPGELRIEQLHALLKLRCDVFIVEQQSPYPDVDGRDLDPDTVHLWAQQDDEVLGTLRVLNVAGPHPVIGRVATAATARGRGVAARLMEQALELCGAHATIGLEAQTQMEGWYARFGFVRCGEDFDDAGVLHLPMTRVGSAEPARLDGAARA